MPNVRNVNEKLQSPFTRSKLAKLVTVMTVMHVCLSFMLPSLKYFFNDKKKHELISWRAQRATTCSSAGEAGRQFCSVDCCKLAIGPGKQVEKHCLHTRRATHGAWESSALLVLLFASTRI